MPVKPVGIAFIGTRPRSRREIKSEIYVIVDNEAKRRNRLGLKGGPIYLISVYGGRYHRIKFD